MPIDPNLVFAPQRTANLNTALGGGTSPAVQGQMDAIKMKDAQMGIQANRLTAQQNQLKMSDLTAQQNAMRQIGGGSLSSYHEKKYAQGVMNKVMEQSKLIFDASGPKAANTFLKNYGKAYGDMMAKYGIYFPGDIYTDKPVSALDQSKIDRNTAHVKSLKRETSRKALVTDAQISNLNARTNKLVSPEVTPVKVEKKLTAEEKKANAHQKAVNKRDMAQKIVSKFQGWNLDNVDPKTGDITVFSNTQSGHIANDGGDIVIKDNRGNVIARQKGATGGQGATKEWKNLGLIQ